MAPTKERPATKTIATNREARHEYFVLEALETGVELKGTEVKSLRAGGVNLKDSWVDIEDGELLVKGMHITPYDHGNIFNRDPVRIRRLLMHKREIRKLGERILVKYFSRLVAVVLDIHYLELDRAGRGYLFNGVVGKQSVKPAAESAFFCCHLYFPFRLSCFSFRSFSGTRPQSRYMRSFPLSFCHST